MTRINSDIIINWFRNEANKLFHEYKDYKFKEKEAWPILHRFEQGLDHLWVRLVDLDDSNSQCVNALVCVWLAKLHDWCWDQEPQIHFELWIVLNEFLKGAWQYIPRDKYEWAKRKLA